MPSQFSLVLVFIITGVLFIFGSLVAGRFLRPKNPYPVKEEAYECGEKAVGQAWINYNIRFYLIALIFVIFDVEAALMFPVASVFKKWVEDGLGMVVLLELLLFVTILVIGLVYVWAKRDLEWVKKVVSDQWSVTGD